MKIKTILIVDDQHASYNSLDLFLKKTLYCNTDIAKTIDEAKDFINRSNFFYDVAIIDLQFDCYHGDYNGKFAGISVMKYIMQHSAKTEIIPYSAYSYDNNREIQEEFLQNFGPINARTLENTFIDKGRVDANQRLLELLIENGSFEQHIINKINILTKEQTQLFVWRCALRPLPFLGSGGSFSFWKAKDRQKYLYSILLLIDIAANTEYDNLTTITLDNVNTAALVSHEKANIINVIIKMANIAANFLHISDDYYSFMIASSIAYSCDSINGSDEFHSVILDDIDIVKQGGGSITTKIYGEVWENFINALSNEGCEYWGDLIQEFFIDGEIKNKEALKLRILVPKEIQNSGAIWVAKYLELPDKIRRKEVLEIIKYIEKQEVRKSCQSNAVPSNESSKTIVFTSINEKQVGKKIKGFVSYSHSENDHEFVEPLITGLRDKIKTIGGFDNMWVDKNLEIGKDWFNQIERAMKETDFGVLLISDSFLNSEFIQKHEMPTLLEKSKKGKCKIFPVIISECFFENYPQIDKMQIFTPNWKDYNLEFKNEIMPFSRLFNDQNKPILNKTNTYCSKLVGEIKAKFNSHL